MELDSPEVRFGVVLFQHLREDTQAPGYKSHLGRKETLAEGRQTSNSDLDQIQKFKVHTFGGMFEPLTNHKTHRGLALPAPFNYVLLFQPGSKTLNPDPSPPSPDRWTLPFEVPMAETLSHAF